jgi:hypothetical protein
MTAARKQKKNDTKNVGKAKRQPKVRKVCKKISRRNILRGTKTAWIFYCNLNRHSVLSHDPQLSFGDVCKVLAPKWKAMSPEDKKVYNDLHLQDKKRYLDQCENLTDEEKKKLRQYKKQKRDIKKSKPKPGLSPYMFFVIKRRPSVVLEAPEANFQMIGKMLGVKWNEMNQEDRQPFVELSRTDKIRYRQEFEVYNQKQKQISEMKKSQKELAKSAKSAARVQPIVNEL